MYPFNENDLELNRLGSIVTGLAKRLDLLTREWKEKELFLAYMEIEAAARKAQERLNDIRYRDADKPKVESWR